MYIPNVQSIMASGLALCGALKGGMVISKGEIMDYAVDACVDEDLNQRCTSPFHVSKNTCYNLEWSAEGLFSHTTAEFKDARSNEIVYYRDTNGDFELPKNEIVYLDFKPKVVNTGNATVKYNLKTCN